jgi:peptide/nickel transport system substrate-binding protein
LRKGIRFSDGQPFDADDVLFSFRVYLDEKVHSPQRDLLIVHDQPVSVEKVDAYTVRFRLRDPYAAAERLFDSVYMLPRHLLEKPYQEGKLGDAWPLPVAPDQIAGLGPFRLKSYIPGQRVVLEKNPYYWKADAKGNRLPYLEELVFVAVSSEDAEALRFQAGETDILNRISAENYAQLSKQEKSDYVLQDAGPSLEYNFLLLNMNDDTAGRLPEVARKQFWFRNLQFRRAISSVIDREGIVRLVYQGKGVPLWGQVTPGNKLWKDAKLPHPPQSVEHAKELLRSAGFSWNGDGKLVDSGGQAVEFTIVASSSNTQRLQIANILQQDLQKIGMQVQVVPLEFRSFVQRVTQTHDYDAAVMGIASGDVDPNGEINVWMSNGSTHLWNLGEKKPATPWEAEIDSLMTKQLTTLDFKQRKALYDRVQEIVAEQLPVICVASPNLLVGSKRKLENFRPAVLEHYTLHNVEEQYWAPQ